MANGDRASRVGPRGVGSQRVVRALGALCVLAGAASSPDRVHAQRTPVLAVPQPVVAAPAPGAKLAAPARPRIEVMFVLDTTGSMLELIEGAKQKIWSIADELATAEPRPELRVGLLAYRDRGDAYVTQRFDLTSDLDAMYEKLRALAADGGGDEPESVNQALHEAVTLTQWTSGPGVYRTVFLVGDAPPHMDYPNDVPFAQTAARARQRGVVINTVQCGQLHGTKPVWTAIARRTQGSYAAIAQSGGMLAIAAPMDAEIARLNGQLADTVLPYGDAAQRERVSSKAKVAKAASPEAGAARLSYLRKSEAGVITGGGDLMDDLHKGAVLMESLPAAQLPTALRGLSPVEQQAELSRRRGERKQIKAKLDALLNERDAYVKEEQKKRSARGEVDGFDGKVKHAVKAQAAAAAGIVYEK